MAIYLVRHAETDANATRVVQVPGVPLSARGRAQAARLAEATTRTPWRGPGQTLRCLS